MDLIDVDVLQFNNLIFSTIGDTGNTGDAGNDRIIGVAELLLHTDAEESKDTNVYNAHK